MTRSITLALGSLTLFLTSGVHRPLEGQGVRGWAGTTVQAVDLRPLASAAGGCVVGVPCYTPLAARLSFAGTQDLSVTAWGFGVQGLSATAFLRGRTGFGSDAVWPRSDDPFDALLAYAQLVRGAWTVRLGRQEIRSGLGFSSFDGGAAQWGNGALQLEGYGGRSLARGLRDPANDALKGIEDFVPDQGVYLFGGSARVRYRTASFVARYQREVLSDRSGLASERASVDWSGSVGRLRLTGAMDYDLGFDAVGKSHLTATMPVRGARWLVAATARRYRPYFSLSTIWGFFEPVAYNEAQLRLSWSKSRSLGVWLGGGWRKYGDTRTEVILRALEDTGWRGEAGLAYEVAAGWSLNGEYSLEWGPGGFLNSGDAALRWSASDRLAVTLSGMSFQQIEQYRLGDGRAVGGGASIDVGLSDRVTFLAGGSLLRHEGSEDGARSPWNQSRGWSTLRIQLGQDPGLANRMRR